MKLNEKLSEFTVEKTRKVDAGVERFRSVSTSHSFSCGNQKLKIQLCNLLTCVQKSNVVRCVKLRRKIYPLGEWCVVS